MTHVPAITATQGAESITTLVLPLLIVVGYVVLVVWLIRWFVAYNKRIQRMEERLEQLQHTVNAIAHKLK